MDYWIEAVSSALDDASVAATTEQIVIIAEAIELSVDNKDMAFGYAAQSHSINSEISDLKKALDAERAKVTCRKCDGYGDELRNFGICDKCRGQGRHAP